MLTAAAARADGVTLTLSRWAGPQADAQQPLLDEYAKLSGDTIKLDAIDYGQLKQKQTLNMSTKTGAYDLIYVPEAWFNEYADAGYLTKLDDMVKDPSLTGADWESCRFLEIVAWCLHGQGRLASGPAVFRPDAAPRLQQGRVRQGQSAAAQDLGRPAQGGQIPTTRAPASPCRSSRGRQSPTSWRYCSPATTPTSSARTASSTSPIRPWWRRSSSCSSSASMSSTARTAGTGTR